MKEEEEEEFEGPDDDDVPGTALRDMQVVVMAVSGGMEDGVDSSVESKGSVELRVGKLKGNDDVGIFGQDENCSFEHGVEDIDMQLKTCCESDVEVLATNRHLSPSSSSSSSSSSSTPHPSSTFPVVNA